MTTSAVRILNSGTWHLPGRRRGLTLLETILAMMVILVVISVGVAYQFNSQDKELLRKASVKIEAMSSRGHANKACGFIISLFPDPGRPYA